MTEEKQTCGQCMKWIAYHRSGTGGCGADLPAWVEASMSREEFLQAANTINSDSTLAEECDLFNPIKKG